MDSTFKALAGIHGVFGVLWIIMIFWFYTAVSAYLSSPTEETAGRLMVSGNVSRMIGGLAIIMGIVVAALTGYLHSSFSFDSTGGILLSIGIVFAIISYVIFGEGFAMRLAKNITPEKGRDLKKYVSLELVFAVLTLIFMALGALI
jgi:hypothetical protein